MVNRDRMLRECAWWSKQGKWPTSEFYMAEVGGMFFCVCACVHACVGAGLNGFISVSD